MKIFNWNTEFVSPSARAGKFQKLRELIFSQEADIVCLTEAYPDAMPDDGQTIKSEISGRANAEKSGARKVVLWSRNVWREIDTIGSPALPEGRFLSAKTNICGQRMAYCRDVHPLARLSQLCQLGRAKNEKLAGRLSIPRRASR